MNSGKCRNQCVDGIVHYDDAHGDPRSAPCSDCAPTVPPSPAQGETAGVSEDALANAWDAAAGLIEYAYENGYHELGYNPLTVIEQALLAARQQLADSAHEVERLNAANAAMRGHMEHVRDLAASDHDGGLTEEIEAVANTALAPASQPERQEVPDHDHRKQTRARKVLVIDDAPYNLRPSPPPTDDIVAGLREKTLAKLKEFVVMSNDQLLKCDLNRLHFTILDAIAALEGDK